MRPLTSRETLETFRREHLFIADIDIKKGNIGNAFVWQNKIVTAGHVADSKPQIITANKVERGDFSFRKIPGRDLAVSNNEIPRTKGFDEVYIPQLGEIILICGHHGAALEYFEILAKMIEKDIRGRYVIELVSMKKKKEKRKTTPNDFEMIFQKGMSGAPGLTSENKLNGLLVAGALGDFEGHRARLEPATALK